MMKTQKNDRKFMEVHSEMEEKEDIIIMMDEDGKEEEFEYLDTIEMNDNEYVVLFPLDQESNDDDEDEVVVLRVEEEDGEEVYVNIEDETEMEEVFEEFKNRTEEEYDFE